MKFAHIADVHLGYEQYHQSWRADDFAKAFREVTDKAIEYDVDFVIISGDLFHKSAPNPKTIREAIDSLLMFKKAGIPVFMLQEKGKSRQLCGTVTWLNTIQQEL